MKALRSFTVRPQLPQPLAALEPLARDLHWSWDRATRELFSSIDHTIWESGGHDPLRLLAEVPSERLSELATDASFLEELASISAGLDAYGTLPRWFQRHTESLNKSGSNPIGDGRIAYFSPEFGISEALPQYSGGLGVLAGDHLKASSDLGLPLVGIGLFYRHGYFRQSLSVDGWQQERFPDLDPHAMALELCDGVRVSLEMAGQNLVAQIWKATVGRTPLYLLDADIPENPPELQVITDRLYGGDVEHRLRQEILLGIGGVRALEALEIPVKVFHTNEGHAGFLGLERIKNLMERDGLSFDEAFESVRTGAVFTTHTPVPAGIDQFPREMIERYFGDWAKRCGISVDQLMDLGHRPGEEVDNPFNMAVMGMHLAELRNGVSALHGEVSREMFAGLWPGVPVDEVPVTSITNGVHGGTWVSGEFDELLTAQVGAEWHLRGDDDWASVMDLDDNTLWAARAASKVRLVDHVRGRLCEHGLAKGQSSSELEWVDSALDPNVLTICFARRMATYKRAAMLLSQPERLKRLLLNEERPVQFVFAGKSHPADDQGKELIRQIAGFADDNEIRHRFMFVEDYDIALARALVQGADIWLNTPVRPMEASGTSGMKAVLNGAMHCSVLDGWWAECFTSGLDGHEPNGWAISSAESVEDEGRRLEIEANSLFDLIEDQVIPLYYEDLHDGVPRGWARRVKESLKTLGPFVGAHRMVEDYVEELYLPAAARSLEMSRGNFSGARTLASFRRRLDENWHNVHIDAVDASEDAGDLGTTRDVSATVYLGGLGPDDVEVQLVVGHVGQSGELESTRTTRMSPTDRLDDSHIRYTAGAELTTAGRMGVTVRVVPHHDLMPNPVEFGLVAWAD